MTYTAAAGEFTSRPIAPPGVVALQRALVWLVGASGAIVFIEPSPYEIVTLASAAVFIATGLRLRLVFLPLLLLLFLVNLGYTLSAIPLLDDSKIANWIATSWYMAFTAMFLAMVISEDAEARLDMLRRGLVMGGAIAVALPAFTYVRLRGRNLAGLAVTLPDRKTLTPRLVAGSAIFDRHPTTRTIGTMILIAAAYMALVPATADTVMADILDTVGDGPTATLMASTALLLVPLTLLGTFSPIAVSLLTRSAGEAGRVAGLVYGVSTIGNVVGTLVTTFALIPTIGSRAITYYFAVALAGCAGILFIPFDKKAS